MNRQYSVLTIFTMYEMYECMTQACGKIETSVLDYKFMPTDMNASF